MTGAKTRTGGQMPRQEPPYTIPEWSGDHQIRRYVTSGKYLAYCTLCKYRTGYFDRLSDAVDVILQHEETVHAAQD